KNKKKEQKKESPKNKFEKPKLPPIQKGGEQGNGQNKQPKLPLPEPVKQGNGQNKQPNLPLPKPVPIPVPVQQGTAETNYQGKWELVSLNSGVSAMHMQLLPTNRLAMFDATSLGKSSIELPPDRCRLIPNTTNQFDCFAHAVEYDLQTNNVRTLKVLTNPWCSSGGLAQDGTLISTGGWEEGEKSIRHYQSCDTCDWKELLDTRLADNRWYATQAMLADGRFVLIGGRRAFNYEFLTPTGNPIPGRIDLPFLLETTDIHENNLYPFVHLAPDGNLFILANFKAILLDVRTNKIVRKYPDLPGGARNYPGSATAAILPINLNNGETNVDIEVLVCGGGQPLAFGKAEKEGIFLPALDTCGKIQVLNPTSNWEMEKMPAARVMSDMLILPNGEILLLNGAKMGASGWQFADDPNLTPYLYTPSKPNGQRFKVLAPTQIPRMYHSSSAVLPEGKILVAGSNTNPGYQFHNVKFPTELRVEKFSPPYLDPALQNLAPKDVKLLNKVFSYGQIIPFSCNIGAPGVILQNDVMVTLYKPPFTTHGYSMDQRLLNLKITFFGPVLGLGNFQLQVQAPARPELAPPGYYLLFVNYRGVPSTGSWVQLH
ncbi:Aldehyde oxidase GLOX1, partial [Bienertia sinuspersici]